MRRFLIFCLLGLSGLMARAATTLPDLNATPATLPNGISVTGAVTLPAASIADAALSSNIPLKNAANTFTLGPNIFQAGAAGNIALTVRAAATPTASFFAVQDSASIAQFRVDSAGNTQIGSSTQNATLNFGNGVDTRKTTISVTAPVVSNTYTIPDVGGAANFALSNGQGTATTLLHGSAAGIPAYGAVVLTTDVSGILPTANGGTGIAYFTAAGPTVARVYTFPDAATTVLTTNAAVTVAQGGTGVATLTANGVLLGNGTGNVSATAVGASNTLLHGNTAAAPTYSAVALASDVTGILADGNLSSNVPLKNAANTFTATQTINAATALTLSNAAGTGQGTINAPSGQGIIVGSSAGTASVLSIGNTNSTSDTLQVNRDSAGAILNGTQRAAALYNAGGNISFYTFTSAGTQEAQIFLNPGTGAAGNAAIGLNSNASLPDVGIQRDGVSILRITDGGSGTGALRATTGTFINSANQIVLGAIAGPNTTITNSAPAASRTYTIDDVGGAAKFAMAASQGTATTLLHGSAAGVPAYSAVSMTADVTGVLPLANGGTNRTDGAAGAFIQTSTFTSGTTVTTTANTTKIRIRVQGGGGGGGGAASAAGSSAAGGGGAAGGYAEKTFTVTGSTAYAYVIGAGGAGGAAGNNAGGNGGNSTFTVGGTTVTAPGGGGGSGSAAGTALTFNAGGTTSVSSSGDVNVGGEPGGLGIIGSATANASGWGGSCLMGIGGVPDINTTAAGGTGTGFGGGGSGAGTVNGGAAQAGGAGAGGIITVDEYR